MNDDEVVLRLGRDRARKYLEYSIKDNLDTIRCIAAGRRDIVSMPGTLDELFKVAKQLEKDKALLDQLNAGSNQINVETDKENKEAGIGTETTSRTD